MKRRSFMALAAAPAVAPLLTSCSGDTNRMEVFSWWTDSGEADGLAELERLYSEAHPDVEFVNAAADESVDRAKDTLATRLQESADPPDSFQEHAGEGLADHIDNGAVEDLSGLYTSQGWNDVMHPGLMENLTRRGGIYGVPVNIHRANLLWYNPSILEQARLEVPQTWSELVEQDAKLSDQGIATLSIGAARTRLHLLETVLLGELGAETYTGLWDGTVGWQTAEVVDAVETFGAVIEVTNIDDAATDVQTQLNRLVDGTAAYTVTGDYAHRYLTVDAGKVFNTDYSVAETPGSVGVFDYLSDVFTLPTGAKHVDNAEAWLTVCGSVDGQDAFNTVNGSLPARIDTDRSLYTDYQAWNLGQWLDESTVVVPSAAHGVAARADWISVIETLVDEYVHNGDASAFVDGVALAYQNTRS